MDAQLKAAWHNKRHKPDSWSSWFKNNTCMHRRIWKYSICALNFMFGLSLPRLLCVWAKNVQRKPCIARWNRNWSQIRPWIMGWRKKDAKSSLSFCGVRKRRIRTYLDPVWMQRRHFPLWDWAAFPDQKSKFWYLTSIRITDLTYIDRSNLVTIIDKLVFTALID